MIHLLIQGKARQSKARQGKARHGKARQGKAWQGEEELICSALLCSALLVRAPPLQGGKSPTPLWGAGGPLLLLGGEKGALPYGKSSWRRAMCGWLDFEQVKQPRVGAVGYSLP